VRERLGEEKEGRGKGGRVHLDDQEGRSPDRRGGGLLDAHSSIPSAIQNQSKLHLL
jgi:hypothetical protein